jgi:1-deoxy-D-xylulose-5-phosphate reductoisomerase
VDWSRAHTWTFEPADTETFQGLALAYEAGRRGGVAPAVYNAANEVAVEAFFAGRLPYLGVVDTIAAVLASDDVPSYGGTLTVDDVLAADAWARERAEAQVTRATAGS